MLIIDEDQPFGDLTPDFYDNELLYLAHDLASRLLPAFDGTVTGIPYPRVNIEKNSKGPPIIHNQMQKNNQ